MKRILAAALVVTLSCAPAFADGTIDTLIAGSALAGTESIPMFQTANPATKTTPSAIATYYNSLLGTGVATFLVTPSSANLLTAMTTKTGTGNLVFATSPTFVTPILGTPTSGTLTNTTGFPTANLAGAGTGVLTALGVNVGSAGAFVTFNGALGTPSSGTGTNLTGIPTTGLTGTLQAAQFPALTGDITTAGGALATTLKNTGPGATGPIGSTTVVPVVTIDAQGRVTALTTATAAGTVSSITPGNGVVSGITASCTQTAVTTSGTLSAAQCINAQVGTTYTFLDTDRAKIVTFSNAASIAVTLPQAGTASAFANGWFVDVVNNGAGTATITPTTSTIKGGATLALTTGQGVRIFSDGTNYQVNAGSASGGSGISSLTPGAGQVSSTTSSCSQSAITSTGTLSTAECLNAQVGTTYTIVDADRGKLVTGTNAASQAYSIAQAGASTTFQAGWFTRVQNKGAGPLVITPTTSTICGGSTLTIYPGATQKITSDGTNYQCDGGNAPSVAISSQTGANYAFVSSNFSQLVNLSNAANQIPTLPQAGTTGFASGWYVQACNQGAGTQTITPTTSTIGGASTYVLRAASAGAPVCVGIVSDGTNYQIVPDAGLGTLSGAVKASGGQLSQAACADLSNGTALCSTTPGTGVATAAAANLSAAGGITSTIASGTSAMGTGAIASAACATVVTTAATNTATTDVVLASFNGDPTAVTGYIPATAGMLTIISYPTSGNVNFKVCNNTSASITPGAITLNWRVVR